ncbi:MAG: hypothetical protein R3D25_06635 [Geminicoccaceae bacterium]
MSRDVVEPGRAAVSGSSTVFDDGVSTPSRVYCGAILSVNWRSLPQFCASGRWPGKPIASPPAIA